MSKHVQNNACAMAIGLGLLAVSALPVLAQPAPNAARNTAPPADMADTNSDRAPNGSLEEYHGLLRASELNGANVYNDQGTAIGMVNDMLVSDDGKVQNVVISVGGFLGIGTHYVSVPFSEVQVQPSRSGNTGVAITNGITGINGTATTGIATTGTTTNGNLAPAKTANNNMAVSTASGTQYFSIVLPGATKDVLTKLPELHYRS